MFKVDISSKDAIARLPLERARAALEERSEWLATVLREAGPELDARQVRSAPVELADGQELADLVRRVTDELDALTDRVEELSRRDEVLQRAAAFAAQLRGGESCGAPTGQPASLGGLVATAVRELRESGRKDTVVDISARQVVSAVLGKATLDTTGFAPPMQRTGRIQYAPTEPIQIADLLPTIGTNASAVVYMEETTFTNAAAERAEGSAYAEAALTYTERSVPVRTVGVSIPVSDEVLEDVEQLAGIVEQRLREMLRLRLDSQIVNGNGTAPNLLGTLNVTGVLTQPLGTDTRLDALYKGMTAIRQQGKAVPSVIVMNPADLQEVALAKTNDGVYLFGAPSDAGPRRIWGVPVVESDVVPAGTAIIGDYQRHAALYVRRGIEVEIGYSGTDFGSGKKTIRAGLRVAVVHFRPKAFCLVTGL
jgi:HK97 family phage major capsid protein